MVTDKVEDDGCGYLMAQFDYGKEEVRITQDNLNLGAIEAMRVALNQYVDQVSDQIKAEVVRLQVLQEIGSADPEA